MNKNLLVHPHELSRKWIDRMKEVGVETIGIHPVGGIRAPRFMKELMETMKTEEFKALIDYAEECGLTIEYELHCAGYLLPRELFETRPELFRMNAAGERAKDYNFCFSNEEAVELFVQRAVELAGQLYKSSHKFYFWLDDGKDAKCHCPKCQQISAADQQLEINNRILKALKEKYSDAKLAYLAYFETMELPKNTVPEEGTFLEYAPIERDMKKPIEQMDPKEKENLLKLIEFFGKKDAKVLEYWYDNSLFSNWTKPPKKFEPNNELIAEDVKYYQSLGFDNIASFACYLGADYEELYGEADISGFKL
jgi:hypothetical protein